MSSQNHHYGNSQHIHYYGKQEDDRGASNVQSGKIDRWGNRNWGKEEGPPHHKQKNYKQQYNYNHGHRQSSVGKHQGGGDRWPEPDGHKNQYRSIPFEYDHRHLETNVNQASTVKSTSIGELYKLEKMMRQRHHQAKEQMKKQEEEMKKEEEDLGNQFLSFGIRMSSFDSNQPTVEMPPVRTEQKLPPPNFLHQTRAEMLERHRKIDEELEREDEDIKGMMSKIGMLPEQAAPTQAPQATEDEETKKGKWWFPGRGYGPGDGPEEGSLESLLGPEITPAMKKMTQTEKNAIRQEFPFIVETHPIRKIFYVGKHPVPEWIKEIKGENYEDMNDLPRQVRGWRFFEKDGELEDGKLPLIYTKPHGMMHKNWLWDIESDLLIHPWKGLKFVAPYQSSEFPADPMATSWKGSSAEYRQYLIKHGVPENWFGITNRQYHD